VIWAMPAVQPDGVVTVTVDPPDQHADRSSRSPACVPPGFAGERVEAVAVELPPSWTTPRMITAMSALQDDPGDGRAAGG
jgi:hypothetical protein